MTCGSVLFFVIENQVLNLIEDLAISGLGFEFRIYF